MSADYSLIPARTTYDMVSDVEALYKCIASTEVNDQLTLYNVSCDMQRTALVGSSAGSYICRLAAMHAEPKPKVLGLMWG